MIPPLRLHGSDSSNFLIMCDIPSIAVFSSESVECFPGWIHNFATNPMGLIITRYNHTFHIPHSLYLYT